MKILVLVPTRQRPDNANRLYDSFCGQTSEEQFFAEQTEMLFCVDDNDPEKEVYLESLGSQVIVGQPNRLGQWLNTAAKKYSDHYDVIGFVGDDTIIRTQDWDDKIREHMKKNAIVYPNDGFQGASLPTSVFMDSKIVKTLGYMVYPELTHLFIDNHWKSLGEALESLVYLEDVIIEHMHPAAGKAENDTLYDQHNNNRERWTKDEEAYHYYVEHILPRDVKHLNV